jgi:hypothetical protein
MTIAEGRQSTAMKDKNKAAETFRKVSIAREARSAMINRDLQREEIKDLEDHLRIKRRELTQSKSELKSIESSTTAVVDSLEVDDIEHPFRQ